MKVVLDMDGVVVATIRLSHISKVLLNILLFPVHWLFLFVPKKRELDLDFIRENDIIILSNRPGYCAWVTRLWFRLRKLPIKKIYCLGWKSNKEEVAEKEFPSIVIDDKIDKLFPLENRKEEIVYLQSIQELQPRF